MKKILNKKEKIKELIDKADAIVIGAGLGLSTSGIKLLGLMKI